MRQISLWIFRDVLIEVFYSTYNPGIIEQDMTDMHNHT